MKFIIENINIDEIDYLIDSNRSKIIFLSAIDTPLKVSRRKNILEINGLIFKSTGIIDSVNRQIIFNIKLRTTYKIVAFFVVFFLISFLFTHKIILNGDSNPSIIDRLIFVSIGIIMLIIMPYSVLNRLQSNFKNKTKQLLENKN